MPMKAVASLRSLLVLAMVSQGVVACAGDATGPSASSIQAAPPSALAPGAASHALVGAVDGVYTFVVDPQDDVSLRIGPNHLDIPSNSICRIDRTPYGPEFWDDTCKIERKPVVITAVVRNADGAHPRIDFQPELRFAPARKVMLYMTLDARADKAEWSNIFYCATNDKNSCVDESKDDQSLETKVRDRLVYRRIKHFSGYIVLSRGFASQELDY
jgi:hypothetical protein